MAVDDRRPTSGARWPTSWACGWSRRPTLDEPRRAWSRRSRRSCRARACPTTTRSSRPRAAAGVPVLSEFDLATRWDDRPLVAITGTDGKTTVTELTRAHARGVGRHAVAVGNTEVPLVAAIEDPTVDVFVVEASSFRLLHSHRFAPDVGTWLNVAPDHLDPTASAATPRWPTTSPPRRASGPTRPPTRWPSATPTTPSSLARAAPGAGPPGHLRPRTPTPTTTSTATGSCSTTGDMLADGGRAAPRRSRTTSPTRSPPPRPSCTAAAPSAGAHEALLAFRGLPHRVTLVGEAGGVRWFDDSKATAPHATRAAVRGFPSVVLIAGGRNKGLDLGRAGRGAPTTSGPSSPSARPAPTSPRRSTAVAPCASAASMDDAVAAAASLARPGDVVLLSPACASFDWYGSYSERGDDFVRAVARAARRGRGSMSHRRRRRAHAHRRRLGVPPPSPHRQAGRRPRGRSRTYVGLLADHRHAQPARAGDGAVGVVGGRPRRLRLVLVRRSCARRCGSRWAPSRASSCSGSTTTAGGGWPRPALVVTGGAARPRARARRGHHGQRRHPLARLRAVLAAALRAGQAHGAAVRGRPPGPPGGVDGRPPPHAACRWRVVFGSDRAAAHAAAEPRHHARARRHRAVAAVRGRHAARAPHGPGRGRRPCVASGLALWAPYRRARVLAFLDPWADYQNTGYQNIQSLVGRGVGRHHRHRARARAGPSGGSCPTPTPTSSSPSSARSSASSAPWSSCALFVGLCLLGARAALLAPDRFGMLLAAGVTVWFGVQAFVNIGAVIGILPDHRRAAAVRELRRLVAAVQHGRRRPAPERGPPGPAARRPPARATRRPRRAATAAR